MVALPPHRLGFPSDNAVSGYYLGDRVSREEIAHVTKVATSHGIKPENTRLRKTLEGSQTIFEILEASVETGARDLASMEDGGTTKIRLVNGDYAEDLAKICLQ